MNSDRVRRRHAMHHFKAPVDSDIAYALFRRRRTDAQRDEAVAGVRRRRDGGVGEVAQNVRFQLGGAGAHELQALIVVDDIQRWDVSISQHFVAVSDGPAKWKASFLQLVAYDGQRLVRPDIEMVQTSGLVAHLNRFSGCQVLQDGFEVLVRSTARQRRKESIRLLGAAFEPVAVIGRYPGADHVTAVERRPVVSGAIVV